jgi:hypothetical protein
VEACLVCGRKKMEVEDDVWASHVIEIEGEGAYEDVLEGRIDISVGGSHVSG